MFFLLHYRYKNNMLNNSKNHNLNECKLIVKINPYNNSNFSQPLIAIILPIATTPYIERPPHRHSNACLYNNYDDDYCERYFAEHLASYIKIVIKFNEICALKNP